MSSNSKSERNRRPAQGVLDTDIKNNSSSFQNTLSQKDPSLKSNDANSNNQSDFSNLNTLKSSNIPIHEIRSVEKRSTSFPVTIRNIAAITRTIPLSSLVLNIIYPPCHLFLLIHQSDGLFYYMHL